MPVLDATLVDEPELGVVVFFIKIVIELSLEDIMDWSDSDGLQTLSATPESCIVWGRRRTTGMINREFQ